MLTLYDDQFEQVGRVRKALKHVRRVLLQSPTGSGKTVMASHMLGNAARKGIQSYFICHRRELLDQTAVTFEREGIDFGFVAAGYPLNGYKSVQICSIDTLKNRLESVPTPGLIIWDEAHHLGAAGWAKVHDQYAQSYHIGLSATPQRLDGKGLDDRFDFLVPGKSVRWLIENGRLAEYDLFSPGRDTSGLHTRMGDFVKAEAAALMDKPKITGDIINHWNQHARDKLTLGFAVSVEHSQHLCQEFMAAGITAVHLDAKTPKRDRREMLRDFARGQVRVIFNVGLFGEGFDVAANSGMDVTVGAVIDAAPTQSLGMWLQRCGRALRKQDGHAKILDHAGNFGRHGAPCDERIWTLHGRDADEQANEGVDTSTRQCPKCFLVHQRAPVCTYCGYKYEINHREIEMVDGELQQVDVGAYREQAAHHVDAAQQSDKWLEKIAAEKGRSQEWVRNVQIARKEKEMLQNRLYNLTIGARALGFAATLTKSYIKKMKPAELRKRIINLEAKMKSSEKIA